MAKKKRINVLIENDEMNHKIKPNQETEQKKKPKIK